MAFFIPFPMKPQPTSNKRVQRAWAMYDWANSVYSLVITSTIFPVYYNSVTQGVDGSDKVSFFGWEVINTVLYSYSISFSFLLIALLAPLLSGIADAAGNKLNFMKFFVYLGSLSCIALYFFTGENLVSLLIKGGGFDTKLTKICQFLIFDDCPFTGKG